MSVLRFQIQHANGKQEVISVEAERALIGSGAHCEIRLPLDQAAGEHVLVQVGAAGVFVQALHFERPPMIGGVPFTQAPLPPEAVLGLGQTQMLITIAEDGGDKVTKKKAQKSNPVLMVAMLAGLGFGVFMILNANAAPDNSIPEEVPSLWAQPLDACDRSAAEAVIYAQQQKGIADSRRERRAFHAHDGIEAVPLYQTAAACFKKGGDMQAYQRASDDANKLQKEMEDDYRTHVLRLRHALEVGDKPSTHKEARTLIEMLQGKDGKFVDFLNETDRQMKQALGRSAS